MSHLSDAHAALYASLEPVLPGRVDPYPPPYARLAAPKVWIGDEETIPATIGQATAVTLVRFPVVVVYDGAVHAQVAGLLDLVGAVIDAVNACPGFESDGSRPAPVPLFGFNPNESTLRCRIVTATSTITARTMCPPSSTAALFPPEPITTGG